MAAATKPFVDAYKPTGFVDATDPGYKPPADAPPIDLTAPLGEEGFFGGVKELGRGVARGAMVTVPEQVGGALQFFGAEETGKAVSEFGERMKPYAPQESVISQVARQDPLSVRGGAAAAGENLPLSFGPMAAGALAGLPFGPVGAGVGAAIGGISALPIFYGSQAQETSKKVEEAQLKAGKTPEEARALARTAGHLAGGVEAGGEFAGQLIPMGAMLKPFAKPVVGAAVKSLFAAPVKSALKTIAKTEVGEVATEMGQQAAETQIEGLYGAGPGATWQDTASVIMPTMIMALFPGALAGGHNIYSIKKAESVLADPAADPEARKAAAGMVMGALGDENAGVAAGFGVYASDKIASGEPVEIGDDSIYTAYKQDQQQQLLASLTPENVARTNAHLDMIQRQEAFEANRQETMQRTGIDPGTGVVGAAAATAVDTGATAQAAAARTAEAGAAEAGVEAAPTGAVAAAAAAAPGGAATTRGPLGLFPFSTPEGAAKRMAVAQQETGVPHTIQPHPTIKGSFVVVPKEEPSAIQEPGATGVLSRPQEGTGEAGGERGGVGPSIQGPEVAGQGAQEEQAQIAEVPSGEAPVVGAGEGVTQDQVDAEIPGAVPGAVPAEAETAVAPAVEGEAPGAQPPPVGPVTPLGAAPPPTTPEGEAASKKVQTPTDKAHEAATSPTNQLPEPTGPQIEAGNYKMGPLKVGPLDVSVESPETSERSNLRESDLQAIADAIPAEAREGKFLGQSALPEAAHRRLMQAVEMMRSGDRAVALQLAKQAAHNLEMAGPDRETSPTAKLGSQLAELLKTKWAATIKGAHYGYIKGTKGRDKEHIDTFVKPGTPPEHAGPVFVVDQVGATGEFDEHKVMLGYADKKEAIAAYKANYPKDFKVGPVHQTTLDEFEAWARDPAKTQRPFAGREEGTEVPLPEVSAPLRFSSGMSRPGDFTTALAANHSIGIDINQLSTESIPKLAIALAHSTGHVFVDTGAYSLFRANLRSAKFGELEPGSGTGLDFKEIFDKYEALARAVSKADEENGGAAVFRLWWVMPDIVGNQTDSLDLLREHVNDVVAHMQFGNAIVPLQIGELSLAEAYDEAKQILGGREFIVGIPSNQRAVTDEQFREFIAARGSEIEGVHLLGAAAESKIAPRLAILREANFDGHVSADANRLRALMYGETDRAEAMRKLLAGEGKAPKAERYEYPMVMPGENPVEVEAKRWVVDAMNDELPVEVLIDKLRATGLPAGTLTAITERLGDRMSAAQQRRMLAPPSESPTKHAPIGFNVEGKQLFEDERGVRFYLKDGVRVTESVKMIPTRGEAPRIEVEHKGEFLTKEEAAKQKKPVTPQLEAPPGSTPLGVKQPFAKNTIFTADAVETARARLKKKLGTLRSGVDPEMLQDGLTIAGAYIEAGIRDFVDFSKHMVDDLGEGIRPYLRTFYEGVRFWPGLDTAGMTPAAAIDQQEAPGADVQPSGTGEAGAGTLEGIPAETLPGPAAGGDAGAGTAGSRQPDVERNGGPPTSGVQPNGGVGTGAAEPPAGAGGKTAAGGSDQQPGVHVPSGGQSDAGVTAPGEPFPQARNFVITDEIELGKGGPVQKFKDNVAAIRLLKQIESENRPATPNEQKVLAKYVGWGGIKQVFPPPTAAIAKGWEARVGEVRELLSPLEHEAAARTILDAHYTSREIVEGIWKIAQRLGFNGGKVLEPSMGTGVFFGLLPADLRSSTSLTGVEQDSITARISKQLYPETQIFGPVGFQDTSFRDQYFNLSVGNPPFGQQVLFDPDAKHLRGFSLHNYFFAKAIDKLAPGGLHIQVVSRYLMDAETPTAREYLAQRTRLIGAIRLPWTAFYANANTEVVTDIVILQKLPQEQWGSADQKWTEIASIPDPLGGPLMWVNSYFQQHPEMILGTMDRSGEMLHENDITVQPNKSEALSVSLERAIQTLPVDIYTRGKAEEQVVHEVNAAAHDDGIKTHDIGSFLEIEDKLYQRVQNPDGSLGDVVITADTQWNAEATPTAKIDPKTGKREVVEPAKWGAGRLARVRAMVGIKNTVRELLAGEATDAPLLQLSLLRQRLNDQYDAFVKEHGFLSDQTNERSFRADPDGPLLLALEHKYDRGVTKARAKTLGVPERPASAEKMPIFSQRVIMARAVPTHVDSVADATTVSMHERGLIDPAYIAQLTGKEANAVIAELTGGDKPIAYLDPVKQTYEPTAEYLSGNVKRKYAEALKAGLTANADALKAVFPPDLKAGDIKARLGAPWIETKVYEGFVKHLFGDSAEARIAYLQGTGGFAAAITGGDQALLTTRWGVHNVELLSQQTGEVVGHASGRDGDDILVRTLNHRDLTVWHTDSDGNRYSHAAVTQALNDRAEEMRQEFELWVFKDLEQRERLVAHYNDNYNTNVKTVYDGSYLTLPGKVPDSIIRFRKHQNDAVARILRTGKVLLDHVVGAGKTFTIISAAMEQRRLGLKAKPMVVVPNHLVKQWAADWYRLYPGAKVLAMSKNDFTKINRRRMLARVATGDWDGVIFAHSSFGFIANEREIVVDEMRKQVEQIQEAIEAVREVEGKKSRTASQYQRQKERLEQKIRELLHAPKDRLLNFQELGVDMLYVDESQEFKNLFFTTQRRNVGSFGNPTGSKKAFDMFIKAQWLQRTNNDSGVGFASGTPISNSLTELYTLQRYLGLTELENRGMRSLDAWLNTFGIVESEYEANVTGTKYKRKDRLRRLTNVPEAQQMYHAFTDAVTMDHIKANFREENPGEEFPIPKVKGGKPRQNMVVSASLAQQEFSAGLQHRMEHLTADAAKDNALAILTDGRKAALDIRLVRPHEPDNPTGKSNTAVAEIKRIYDANTARLGTQLVFLDLSMPLKHGKKDATDYLKQARELLGDPTFAPFGTLVSQWDRLRAALIEHMSTLNEDTAEGQIAKIEDFLVQSDEITAAVTTVDSGFSVYDDMRQKMIDAGIPAREIAFIHDANTETQKQDLFDRVNAGAVRVLMGSTFKMGAGTNVQKKAVALHHMDVPWRPSDIEQREGRIIRQNNEFRLADPNFEVEVIAYATEGTSDVFFWQTQEQKLNAINSLRNATGERELEEVSSDSMSAAEMKALASGNPLILEDVKLTEQVRKLQAAQRRHTSEQQDLDSQVAKYRREIAGLPAQVEQQADIAGKVTKYLEDPFEGQPRPTVEVDGKALTAQEADQHIREAYAAAEAKAAVDNEAAREQQKAIRREQIALEDAYKQAHPRSGGYSVRAITDLMLKHSPEWAKLEGEGEALEKAMLKPTFSVNVGGKLYSSLEGAETAIVRAAGDVRPFRFVPAEGEPFVRRADLDAYIQPIVRRMEAIGSGHRTLGTLAGVPVEIDWTMGRYGRGVEVSYGTEGRFLTEQEKTELRPAHEITGHDVTGALIALFADTHRVLENTEKQLKAAQEGLAPVEAQIGKPWGKEEELEAKRARLTTVRNELAGIKPEPETTEETDEDAGDKLDIGAVPAARKPTIAVVNAAIASLKARWKGAPNITVVQSVADLPGAKRPESTRGLYRNGAVYLVADNLTPESAQFVVAHEVLGHFGLAGILGNQLDPLMDQIYRSNATVRKMADARVTHAASKGLTYSTTLATEEALADLAAKNRLREVPQWKLLVAAIRKALRAIGIDVAFSDADIVALLANARAYVKEGRETAGVLATERHSLADDTVKLQQLLDRQRRILTGVEVLEGEAKYEALREIRRQLAELDPNERYSLGEITENATNVFRELLMRSPRKMNPLLKGFQTQFHKAQKHAGFRSVYQETQAYLRDISSFATAAADFATGLLPKLGRPEDVLPKRLGGAGRADPKDIKAVAHATFAATLADMRPSEAQLLAGFTAKVQYGKTLADIDVPPLTDKQVDLFRQARMAIDRSIDQTAVSQMTQIAKGHGIADALAKAKNNPDIGATLIAAALQEKLQNLRVGGKTKEAAALAADIDRIGTIAQDALDLQDRGYAPLMRFGQYTLKVEEVVEQAPTIQYFGMFETKRELYAMEREMKEQYPNAVVTTGVLSKESHKLLQGLNLSSLETFAKLVGMKEDDAFQAFYRQAVASRSALKHLIHRKGIAGYNEDLPRVLASFITSSARLASRTYHYAAMKQAAASIADAEGDVKDEATKLVDYVQNPMEEAPTVRGLLFVNFIGGSIASALTNLTQTTLMTAPWLSQYSNPAAAAAKVVAAMRAGKPPEGSDLEKALKRAALEGVTDPQEIHQLYAESIRGIGTSLWARKGLRVWGSMFSLAESFNRRVTFIAAFQTAQAPGGLERINATRAKRGESAFADAYDFAEHAVEATQGVYNRGNRPNYARGPIGATIFTFRQFTIAYLEFLSRLPAREKAVAGSLLLLATGLQGAPGADDLEDLIDTIGQLMGYNTNSKKYLREKAVDILGDNFGGLLTHGVSTSLPFDVQGRLSFSNIIPGTALFKQSDATRRAEEIAEVAGPLGGLYKQGTAGFEALVAGNVTGLLSSAFPIAVQNLMKGLDMWTSGMYKDARGGKIIETDKTDAMFKAIGIQPENVAGRQRIESDVQQSIALVKAKESAIAEKWARSILDKDEDGIRAAVRQLHEWNTSNPEWPIQITPYQIRRRVQEKMVERGARILKAAPREVRATVQRELQ